MNNTTNLNQTEQAVVLKNIRFWNGKDFEIKESVTFSDGKILAAEAAYDKVNQVGSELKVVEGDGALLLPALFALGIDFMEPRRDDVYTFADGKQAMRRGGFYGGLYESAANPIDDAEKLSAVKQRASALGVDIRFLASYSVGFGSDSLSEMLELAPDVVGFGDGNASISSTRFLRLAMEYGKMTNKRFFFQPMDKTLRKNGCVHEGKYSDLLGMKGIPRIAETIAAYTILETARFLNAPIHFKQVTCGETLDLIRDARQKGIDVTCDVGMYHLLFDDSSLLTLCSASHLCPPLRSEFDKKALWAGIADGTVDAISINHTPVLRQDTEVNFEDALPGAVGLEVALPALWKELSSCVGAARAIELLSSAPARLAGETKSLVTDNFVLLAPDKPHKVLPSDFSGHVNNSPLLGKELPSSVLGSYIGGLWTSC